MRKVIPAEPATQSELVQRERDLGIERTSGGGFVFVGPDGVVRMTRTREAAVAFVRASRA